ncbi:MAG: hypothetical protein K2L02_06120 [Clostridia bacterium]|nr:hypothetical protein [Clostridia bacterium]
MKKMLAAAVMVIIGASSLCGNAMSVKDETYCDDGIMPLDISSVVVNYENKDENTFKMVMRHPSYSFSANRSDCACIAGANVIGFYDRYDENLIPEHTAGKFILGRYVYNNQDTYVYDLIRQLYSDMGTNNEGTTVTEFKNGMITYCNRKGKSISFSSCMRNSRFDYSVAKSYMESNQPVVLFCSGYNVADVDFEEKSDRINYYESAGNHVMVGFGYVETTYTLANSANLLYEYIMVASGVPTKTSGYYDIHYNTNVNDAYAVNIY